MLEPRKKPENRRDLLVPRNPCGTALPSPHRAFAGPSPSFFYSQTYVVRAKLYEFILDYRCKTNSKLDEEGLVVDGETPSLRFYRAGLRHFLTSGA